jgi:hypothetical protein
MKRITLRALRSPVAYTSEIPVGASITATTGVFQIIVGSP